MGNAPATTREHPLKPRGRDFPFYRDERDGLSTGGWLLVLAGVIAGFLALVVPLPFADPPFVGWLRILLFIGLPLLGLRMASPAGWMAIFARVGVREVVTMVVFALLTIIISMAIGVAVNVFGTTSANASVAEAAQLSGTELSIFFAKVAVQLLGEELITILPFLAILAFCRNGMGMGRTASVLVAWLVSAAAFGLIHLPTYNWNLIQCLVVIGGARLVLTGAYIWSKNIWVSTGAHILNDWTLIALTTFVAPLATSL